MLNNKKAQIGETITWVVATLVIIVVLGISVLVTHSISVKKTIFLDDKEKDFIATKSITSFLRNDQNIELLMVNDEKKIDDEMKKFLEILPTTESVIVGVRSTFGVESYSRRGVSNWNFEIGEDEDEWDYGTKFYSEKIKLNFWANCYDGGCR